MVETYVPDFGTGTYKVMGQRKTSITAFDRVVGRPTYSADYRPPGMLFAASLHCPYARATVVSMDTSAAEAVPGVKLVMNYFNFPKVFIAPEAYFAGEEVAAVVAVDQDTCYKALQLIKVTYNKLAYTPDMYESQKSGAPMVLPNTTSNVRYTTGGFFSDLNAAGLWNKRVTQDVHGFGDAQAAMAKADKTIHVTDMRHGMIHCPVPNGKGLTTDFTPEDPSKSVTYWTDSKGLYADRNKFAAITGTPIGKAHLVSPYAGGLWGLGMLNTGDRRERSGPISAWASYTLNLPVWHHYNMHEETVRSCYKASQTDIQIGLKNTGEIVSWIEDNKDESGNSDGSAEGGAERSTPMMAYNRVCRDVSLRTARVASNRLLVIDYVGYSSTTGCFAAEIAMDYASEALNMDPTDVRKVNCMKKGGFDAHWNTALAQASNEGHKECLDAVMATSGWKSVWTGWAGIKAKTGAIRHGIGVALKTHTGGSWSGTGMLTKFYPDGTFECVSSVGDSGQGEPTAIVMITAEILGVPYENGSLTRGSTSQPYSLMLGGSTGTWNHGYATWEAAMNVRKQVLSLGAELFPDASGKPVDIALLDMDQGGVFLRTDPTKKQTYTSVFGRYSTRPAFENKTGAFEICAYAYRRATEALVIPREKGAAIWNIDVDTETGEISNFKCATSDNVGKIMNPRQVENQQSQGANHGGSWVLWQECVYDPASGRGLAYNWIYDFPSTHMDFAVTHHIIEIPGDLSHPYGATAASEGQPNPHSSAIANAIYNAIGVRLIQAPFTPDKILKALGKVV